jgi:hypothetical protein
MSRLDTVIVRSWPVYGVRRAGEPHRNTEHPCYVSYPLPDGKVIHIRTGRKYGQVKLWMRGENELENGGIAMSRSSTWR